MKLFCNQNEEEGELHVIRMGVRFLDLDVKVSWTGVKVVVVSVLGLLKGCAKTELE